MKLWILKHRNRPGYVLAIDGACDVLMAFTNKKDAKREAKRQNDLYDLECYAVRADKETTDA